MEARNVHPRRTLIELNDVEREELMKAITRMGQSFIGVPEVLTNLNAALVDAHQKFTEFVNECQRLDPAFSGPAPVADDEESFPIRRSPFRDADADAAQIRIEERYGE